MRTRNLPFCLLVAALVLSACLPSGAKFFAQIQGTPTATPFLPGFPAQEVHADQPISAPAEGPKSVGDAPITVDFGRFAAPSEPSDIEIPAPMGALQQPEGQVNILLLGSDQRPNDGGFRTDVIVLLTLNPKDNSVSLTSFPRDLYVYEPGWRMNRINAAWLTAILKCWPKPSRTTSALPHSITFSSTFQDS